jgi:hypothetical protein
MSEFFRNPPEASSLMEASRSFGNYDLAAALADIIDNSITAGASKIAINCQYDEESSLISVSDNGTGMTRDELINAMRPASKNPLEERDVNDLGRFGLGLKTASFSQARELTVISRKNNSITAARWDLDNIANWSMEIFSGVDAENLLVENPVFTVTTEVIWRKLDRVTENGNMAEDDFNRLMIFSADQLSLIFHRYLEKSRNPSKQNVQLFLNGAQLEPHDPFKREHPATQELDTETIKIGENKIVVTPFILPHYSKLGSQEYEKLAAEEGYIKNQGFYVYRNRRLIIHGTWFRLFRHGELSKLARVRVDIPNSLDEEWRITVDKSDAQIPTTLKRRLKDLIEKIGNVSSRVYRQRGSRIMHSGLTPIWLRSVKQGQIKFSVNGANPAIEAFRSSLSSDQKVAFSDMLRIIASGFPVEALHTDYADNPNSLVQSETDPAADIALGVNFYKKMLDKGMAGDEIEKLLETTEPFSLNLKQIIEMVKSSGLDND